MKRPSVFIAGTKETLNIARNLQHSVSEYANATLWTEGIFNLGISVVESLMKEAENTDLAVFIFGSDDLLINNIGVNQSLRQNLIFELGLFIGKIGSSRVILAIPENIKFHIPSDLMGLPHFITGIESNIKNKELSDFIKNSLTQIVRTEDINKSFKDKNIQYYSCFISYSIKDKEFVDLLFKDLTEIGVSCWLDSMEMRIGDELNSSIRRSIQEQDRLLLILSNNSINSRWVKKELSASLELEKKRGKTVLFPIRIDDSIFETSKDQLLISIKERHIGDFTNWHNEKDYKKSFSHMVRDLMTISSVESKGGF